MESAKSKGKHGHLSKTIKLSNHISWTKLPMFLIYCVLKGPLEMDPEAQKWTQKPRNGPRNGPRGPETDPEMDPEAQKRTQRPRNGPIN